ncbi:hypothetical protein UFOVP639_1, partial [uncultured Caudovirales phage]
MNIDIVEGFYIHITADHFKELVWPGGNGEGDDIRTKEIYVPLDGDYSMWIEEDEYIE